MLTCYPECSIDLSDDELSAGRELEAVEEDYAEEATTVEVPNEFSEEVPVDPFHVDVNQPEVGTVVPLFPQERYQAFWEDLDYVQAMCLTTADLIERVHRSQDEGIKGDFLNAVKNNLAILQESAIKSLTSDHAVILREYTKPARAARPLPSSEEFRRVPLELTGRRFYYDIERDIAGPFNLRLKMKAIEDKALAERRLLGTVIPLSTRFATENLGPIEMVQVPEHGSDANPLVLDD